jgi:hypothetical protein
VFFKETLDGLVLVKNITSIVFGLDHQATLVGARWSGPKSTQIVFLIETTPSSILVLG